MKPVVTVERVLQRWGGSLLSVHTCAWLCCAARRSAWRLGSSLRWGVGAA